MSCARQTRSQKSKVEVEPRNEITQRQEASGGGGGKKKTTEIKSERATRSQLNAKQLSQRKQLPKKMAAKESDSEVENSSPDSESDWEEPPPTNSRSKSKSKPASIQTVTKISTPNKRPSAASSNSARSKEQPKAKKKSPAKKVQPAASKSEWGVVGNGKVESDDDGSDWEDVPSLIGNDQPSTSSATIHIDLTKEKKKTRVEQYIETFLRQTINRYRKELLADVHKASLLCLMARADWLSGLCNSRFNQSLCLSILPIGFVNQFQTAECQLENIHKLVKWFQSAFTFRPIDNTNRPPKICDFELMCEARAVTSYLHLALLFVCLCRAAGLQARFVYSIQPTSLKQTNPTQKKDLLNGNSAKSRKETQEASFTNASVKARQKAAKLVDMGKCDYWAEVYAQSDERWICVNLNFAQPKLDYVDRAVLVEQYCTQPVHYVIACDNHGGLRDLSQRYIRQFFTPNLRRMRTDADWCKATVHSLRNKLRPLRDTLEDMQFKRQMEEAPLPTIVSEYKNHPLYVLRRDLLKYEALYPADSQPIGYVKKEPVFARALVHILHNRDGWLKLARVIKEGEEPYKIVKARPKFGVPKAQQEERSLDLFGRWQTDQFVPQPVVEGVIPRNAFGNCEIFQACMQPEGTVHLRLAKLPEVARKLEIDCVPVMVGWEFIKHRNTPVIDGYLVCAEHEQIVRDAWRQEDQRRQHKLRERQTERAVANWERLCKAVLLRSRVQRKFTQDPKVKQPRNDDGEERLGEKDEVDDDDMEASLEVEGNERASAADPTLMHWPQNKQQFTL